MEVIDLHEGRFVVPDVITLEQLEDCKRKVCTRLPRGTKYEDYYPPFVVTYASGRRPGDCEGSGPGVVYAKGMIDFLHERGLQCFSGLQVPPGVDWETFMLRLTGENGKREKPRVLIVILTAALYKSKPCLKEIDMAIKHEVELLPVRFEDKLPCKEDQWTNLKGQDWEMRKLRVQEKLNALNNIPNPGTVLNRANALKDIMAEIDKYLPTPDAPTPPEEAPASPAMKPAAAARPPPPNPSDGPSDGTRFPVGSRVYVNRGHGEEVSGYVTTYDAAKDLYTVELGERGSGGEQERCSDKDLRMADNPISRFFDSARHKVGSLGSLFGVIPLREGVPGNADASEPTPQLPPLRFTLKERVECRDRGQSWQAGTVVSVEPLMVQPDGFLWTAGYTWDEVRGVGLEMGPFFDADGVPREQLDHSPFECDALSAMVRYPFLVQSTLNVVTLVVGIMLLQVAVAIAAMLALLRPPPALSFQFRVKFKALQEELAQKKIESISADGGCTVVVSGALVPISVEVTEALLAKGSKAVSEAGAKAPSPMTSVCSTSPCLLTGLMHALPPLMVAVSVAAKEAHTNSKSYAQEQMAQAGMLTTCKDARKAGFSCKEAREVGFSCKEAMEAGFSCKEAREAGFSCKDASEAGFTPLEWLRG